MSAVSVVGGGPAGAMAALSALEEGANVTVYEKAGFPRHKVCGEFLSGEAVAAAKKMRVWERLESAGAVPIRRLLLQVGRTRLSAKVDEPLYGLSRFALDSNLLSEASDRGARVVKERKSDPERPAVLATGRSQKPPQGGSGRDRLFGFKAHFTGPVSNAVELYLFNGCYVGVSPVEGGRTNVCGLAPLYMLGEGTVDPDELLQQFAPLHERLAPLHREWPWLATGPVTFGRLGTNWREDGLYPAGDALGFVDPFTGAGQANAMLTGLLAGRAAAAGQPVAAYLKDCRKVMSPVFAAAGVIRFALRIGVAEALARFVPATLLFRLTRPRIAF